MGMHLTWFFCTSMPVSENNHRHAYDELLLTLPDIVAWSWVRPGEWRRRIIPILTTVRTV